MSSYFIDLKVGNLDVIDREGVQFDSLEDVRCEVQHSLYEEAKRILTHERIVLSATVRDHFGVLLVASLEVCSNLQWVDAPHVRWH